MTVIYTSLIIYTSEHMNVFVSVTVEVRLVVDASDVINITSDIYIQVYMRYICLHEGCYTHVVINHKEEGLYRMFLLY